MIAQLEVFMDVINGNPYGIDVKSKLARNGNMIVLGAVKKIAITSRENKKLLNTRIKRIDLDIFSETKKLITL
jgi:hypothetical protein